MTVVFRYKMLTGHSSGIGCLAFSADGKTLASGDRRNIISWNVETCKKRHFDEGHSNQVRALAFYPNTNYDQPKILISGSSDKSILVWDVDTGKLRSAPFLGHEEKINCITFSKDGATMLSASMDKTIIVWAVLVKWACQCEDIHMPIQNKKWVWKWEMKEKFPKLSANAEIMCCVITPEYIISGDCENAISVWNINVQGLEPTRWFITNSSSVKDAKDSFSQINALAVCPNPTATASTKTRILSSGKQSQLILWNIDKRESTLAYTCVWCYELDVNQPDINFLSISFSNDGKKFVSGDDKSQLKMWLITDDKVTQPDMNTFKERVHGLSTWIKPVAFSPTNTDILVSGAANGTLVKWELENYQRRECLVCHTPSEVGKLGRVVNSFYNIWHLNFSQQGNFLEVQGYDDKSPKYYNYRLKLRVKQDCICPFPNNLDSGTSYTFNLSKRLCDNGWVPYVAGKGELLPDIPKRIFQHSLTDFMQDTTLKFPGNIACIAEHKNANLIAVASKMNNSSSAGNEIYIFPLNVLVLLTKSKFVSRDDQIQFLLYLNALPIRDVAEFIMIIAFSDLKNHNQHLFEIFQNSSVVQPSIFYFSQTMLKKANSRNETEILVLENIKFVLSAITHFINTMENDDEYFVTEHFISGAESPFKSLISILKKYPSHVAQFLNEMIVQPKKQSQYRSYPMLNTSSAVLCSQFMDTIPLKKCFCFLHEQHNNYFCEQCFQNQTAVDHIVFPFDISLEKTEGFLSTATELGSEDAILFQSQFVKALIQHKWNAYAFRHFALWFYEYVIHLSFLVVWTILRAYDSNAELGLSTTPSYRMITLSSTASVVDVIFGVCLIPAVILVTMYSCYGIVWPTYRTDRLMHGLLWGRMQQNNEKTRLLTGLERKARIAWKHFFIFIGWTCVFLFLSGRSATPAIWVAVGCRGLDIIISLVCLYKVIMEPVTPGTPSPTKCYFTWAFIFELFYFMLFMLWGMFHYNCKSDAYAGSARMIFEWIISGYVIYSIGRMIRHEYRNIKHVRKVMIDAINENYQFSPKEKTTVFYPGKLNYLYKYLNWWNFLDWLQIFLALLCCILFWANIKGFEMVLAVTCFLRWFGVFYYLRGFDNLGKLVRMVFQISASINWFLVVLCISVLATADSLFLLLNRNRVCVDNTNTTQCTDSEFLFTNPGEALFTVYNILILGDSSHDFLQLTQYDWQLQIIYAVSKFFVTIVLLNLLIAIMQSGYGRFAKRYDIEQNLLRAQIIDEVEMFMTEKDPPKFLHILVAQHRLLNNVYVSPLDKKIDELDKRNIFISNQLKSMSEQMKQNFKILKDDAKLLKDAEEQFIAFPVGLLDEESQPASGNTTISTFQRQTSGAAVTPLRHSTFS